MTAMIGKSGVRAIIDELLKSNDGRARYNTIVSEVRIRTRLPESKARDLVGSIIDSYKVEYSDGIPMVSL